MLILAATDATREGRISISHAIALAEALGANVLPVFTTAPRGHERPASGSPERSRLLPPVELERRLGESAGAAMARLADEHDASIVVASSARASTLRQVTGRAPVVELLRSTDRPVLAVGPAAREPRGTGPYHIAAATHADSPSKRLIAAVQEMSAVRPQHVMVSVLGIYQPTIADEGRNNAEATIRAVVQEAAEARPEVAIANVQIVEPSLLRPPFAAVLKAAERGGFDAIAVESSPSGTLDRILNRDLSLDLTNASSVPVLHVAAGDG